MACRDPLGEYSRFPSRYQAGCQHADRGLRTREQKKHCPEAAENVRSLSNVVLPPPGELQLQDTDFPTSWP